MGRVVKCSIYYPAFLAVDVVVVVVVLLIVLPLVVKLVKPGPGWGG